MGTARDVLSVVAAMAFVSILAGCGDDADSTASEEAGSTTTEVCATTARETNNAASGEGGGAPSNEIEVIATNFEYDPVDSTVAAEEEFAVSFTNDAGLAHNWTVLMDPIECEAELETDNILIQVEADTGGGSTTESSTIDEAGTYQVVCTIPRHFNDGMAGELTVE